MYQSIPSLTTPPDKPPENFLKGEFPTARAQRKCKTPTPGAVKSFTPGAIIFKNPAKNNKTRDRNYEKLKC